jgi:hypothetical protein
VVTGKGLFAGSGAWGGADTQTPNATVAASIAPNNTIRVRRKENTHMGIIIFEKKRFVNGV